MKIKDIILEVVLFMFYYYVLHTLRDQTALGGVIGNLFSLALYPILLVASIVLADKTCKYLDKSFCVGKKKSHNTWYRICGNKSCFVFFEILLGESPCPFK